jgi:hypothetical protein
MLECAGLGGKRLRGIKHFGCGAIGFVDCLGDDGRAISVAR